jgi:hypothetical protein
MSQHNLDGLSVPILANIWRSNVEMLSGDAAKPFTPRQFGQLKQLRKHLGALTNDVICWSIRNWPLLCLRVRELNDLPSASLDPHIGFMLAHYADAVSLMYTQAKNKVVKSAADIHFIAEMDKVIGLQRDWWEEFCEVNKEILAKFHQQHTATHPIGKEIPHKPTQTAPISKLDTNSSGV